MKMSQHLSALILILHECKEDSDKQESETWGSGAAGLRFRKNLRLINREIHGLWVASNQISKARKLKKARQN